MIPNANDVFFGKDGPPRGKTMNTVRRNWRAVMYHAVLLMWWISALQGTQLAYGQEVLRGVDLSEVSFALLTPGPFHKALEERAHAQFANSGLKLRAESGFPRILLTLMPVESEHCKGVDIYQRKLELQEEITLARTGYKKIVTTWFYGNEFGFETKTVTVKDLQKDLDRMLNVFIEQYQFLNPKKRPRQ
jgi:hypothetical protein